MRNAAVAAIAPWDLTAAAQFAVQSAATAESESDIQQDLAPVLGRRQGSAALATAITAAKISADSAKLIGRVLNAAGSNDADLSAAVNAVIGVSSQRMPYDAEMVKGIAAGSADGNAARGRDVFLSKLANCTACHKVAGQGGDIGPDLSNVGKGLPPELLVESVLWPSRQVKEGYMAVRVTTASGQTVTGYKIKDTPDELQIRDTSTNQVRSFARSDVEEMVNAGSVMPEGLTSGMTERELHDLIRYLSELGKAPAR